MKPVVLATAAWLALLCAPAAQDHEHAAPGDERLGRVHFDTSCAAAAVPAFDRAVALLHSFEFGDAIRGFEAALVADPTCAMAHWGIALSHWGNPFSLGQRSPQQLAQGRAAVERATALAPRTDRERGYVAAVGQLYADAGSRPQTARLEAYRDAMAELSRRLPSDTEAAIFHALALTAAEDPADKSYASRLQAVGILEPLFERMPDHPGLAHYIIHSYDVPTLAPRALRAAERYAAIAPSAPHALHMPSHTFTRVGAWQASIDTNVASAAAARRQRSTAEELHASDYQMYAYLQTAQDDAARRLLAALPETAARFDPKAIGGAAPASAGYFALAAMPARFVIERGAWAESAALVRHPSGLPYVDALTEFARALGAARTGDIAAAEASVARLAALHSEQAARQESYWTQQVAIQHEVAGAWLAFARSERHRALAMLRAAADAEDATEKSAVTPGPLAPARELLGEMLLASGDPRSALEAFTTTLAKEPNRFRALAGAAAAAGAAGDAAAAATYSQSLVAMCDRASQPLRAELQQAHAAIRR